jgi:hypothetical protein
MSKVVALAASRSVPKVIIVTTDFFPADLVVLSDRPTEVLFMEQADPPDPGPPMLPVIEYKGVGYETFSGVVNCAPQSVSHIHGQYTKMQSANQSGVIDEQIAILESSIKEANDRLAKLTEQRKLITETETTE